MSNQGHLAAIATVGIAYHALQLRRHLFAADTLAVEPPGLEAGVGHQQGVGAAQHADRRGKLGGFHDYVAVHAVLSQHIVHHAGIFPGKAGQGFNLANLLLSEESAESGQKAVYDLRAKEAPQALLPLERAEHQDWITFLEDEHLAYQRADHFEARLKGTVMHDILSRVVCTQAADLPEAARRAASEVLSLHPEATWAHEITARIDGIMAEPALHWIFAVGEGKVYTEYEVVDRHGHTRRMDRIIVTSDEVRILDYKSSGLDPAREQAQVKSYIDIMSRLFPDHRVSGYLLYADSLEVVAVDG